MSHVLRVDLGGTKTSIALVDSIGNISEKEKLPAARDFESFTNEVCALSPGNQQDDITLILARCRSHP